MFIHLKISKIISILIFSIFIFQSSLSLASFNFSEYEKNVCSSDNKGKNDIDCRKHCIADHEFSNKPYFFPIKTSIIFDKSSVFLYITKPLLIECKSNSPPSV